MTVTEAVLREALNEARLQLVYVNERHPMGSTAGILSRIDHALSHPTPKGRTTDGEAHA